MHYDNEESYQQVLSEQLKSNYLFPQPVTWFEDHVSFETIREADEWVYSDAYNKIGNESFKEYNGYIARDFKLVHALLFELVRNKQYEGKIRVWDYYVIKKYYYLLWIER